MEAAVDAPSPSESSELRALITASEAIGSGPGVTVSFAIDIGVSGGLDNFCRFFGCGSSVEETLCLERTGTGIVVRDISRAGWISCIRIGIRHENWVVNANRVGGWMVPFHMSWRTQGSGTKVWFRIFDHVGRDPSMCYQCW